MSKHVSNKIQGYQFKSAENSNRTSVEMVIIWFVFLIPELFGYIINELL